MAPLNHSLKSNDIFLNGYGNDTAQNFSAPSCIPPKKEEEAGQASPSKHLQFKNDLNCLISVDS
ncbi:hypothetical protein EMIT0194P_100181 [Pseudomonas serbica]